MTKTKIYKYDYPEQRELSKDLKRGDITILANWAGYARSTISKMCSGDRKMPENVKKLIEKIYELQSEFESYAERQKNIAG